MTIIMPTLLLCEWLCEVDRAQGLPQRISYQ